MLVAGIHFLDLRRQDSWFAMHVHDLIDWITVMEKKERDWRKWDTFWRKEDSQILERWNTRSCKAFSETFLHSELLRAGFSLYAVVRCAYEGVRERLFLAG